MLEVREMYRDAFCDKRLKEIVSTGDYFFSNVFQGEVLMDGYGRGSFQRV